MNAIDLASSIPGVMLGSDLPNLDHFELATRGIEAEAVDLDNDEIHYPASDSQTAARYQGMQ